jgi:hypothetical protein
MGKHITKNTLALLRYMDEYAPVNNSKSIGEIVEDTKLNRETVRRIITEEWPEYFGSLPTRPKRWYLNRTPGVIQILGTAREFTRAEITEDIMPIAADVRILGKTDSSVVTTEPVAEVKRWRYIPDDAELTADTSKIDFTIDWLIENLPKLKGTHPDYYPLFMDPLETLIMLLELKMKESS